MQKPFFSALPLKNSPGGLTVLELFLFINPIGTRCREAERAVQRLAKELTQKVKLRFVPLVNFTVIDRYMAELGLDAHDLDLRNQLFDTAYQIAVDYKAAQFQGNKKARALLLAEQAPLTCPAQAYDSQVAAEAVAAIGFDVAAFNEDRAREAMHQCLCSDQAIALEMAITSTPAAVIFDTNKPQEGLRLEQLPSLHMLKRICEKYLLQPELPVPEAMLRVL